MSKIKAILGELHRFEGQLNWQNPIALRLEYEDGTSIRVRGASDGESIALDRLPLEPFNLDENTQFEVHDLSDRFDPKLREREAGTPTLVRDARGTAVGLALPLTGETPLCIWNYGDDLYWGGYDELLGFEWSEDVDEEKPRLAEPAQVSA